MNQSSLRSLVVPLLLAGLLVSRNLVPPSGETGHDHALPAPARAPHETPSPEPRLPRAVFPVADSLDAPASTRRFTAPALEEAPEIAPVYRPELARAIAPDRWRRLDAVHKRMLDRLAPPADRGDGASPDDKASNGNAERPWICFAPGTPDDLVAALTAFSRGGLGERTDPTSEESFGALAFQFFGTARWSRTTLTPSVPSPTQGQPVTLTWSFIPDGTNIPGGSNGAGEPAAPSNLKAWLNGIYGSQAVWQAHFQQVFDKWQSLTGVRYVFEPNDDGDSFPSSIGSAGVRGDVRIGGHFIDGNSNTLAYNFGPPNGDMVLDTADNFFSTTSSSSLRLRNVIAHEHGHGLGIAHVCPINQTKLMEPFATTSFDGPQHDDIFSANRQYGDRLEDTNTDPVSGDNDTSANATELGTLPVGSTTMTNLSIDDDKDSDYYRITAPTSGMGISVILHPLGSSYLEGAQNADSSCSAGTLFNSLAVHNLGFELRGTNGSTILASRNAVAAGSDESLAGFSLPSGTGPYFIRVFGDSANNTQLYELTITLANPPPVPALSIGNIPIGEGAGPALVQASLSQSTTVSVSVQFASLPDSATPPTDYASVSGSLVFPPGTTTQTISIPIVDDTLHEANESFAVTLSNPTNATLGTAVANVTILDNDAPPVLTIADATASETDDSVVFGLALSAVSGLPASVQFTTVSGTATSNLDFVQPSGTVTFPAGTTTASLTVAMLPDDEAEADETFDVALSLPVNATLFNTNATGRILDDDAPATLAGTASLVSESSSSTTLAWHSIPGRTYTVEQSDNLSDWEAVPGATRITGATAVVPSPAGIRRFFRVIDDPEP